MKAQKGFTLVELIVTCAVLGAALLVAIPGFANWLPDFRLRGAATDLFSNMHLAKMGAVKDNTNWAIVFETGSNRYRVCSHDGGDGDWTDHDETTEATVHFSAYESGVGYGGGNATKNATVSGGSLPTDGETYNTVLVFNSRGTCNAGYVYLQNEKDTAYAVGTRSSGVIRLVKWNPSNSEWE